MTAIDLPPSLLATLPGSAYTDPAIFALEQAKIFEQMWFCAVRGADLPGRVRSGPSRSAGRACWSPATATASSARSSTSAGTAAPGCARREAGTVKRAFQCPYHAWTYDLDGKLIAAPNLTKMPDVDRVEFGLHRVAPAGMARLRLGLPGRRAAVVRGRP